MAERIYTQDTAVVEASIYSEDKVTPVTVADVTWDFINPDGTNMTVSSLPATGTTGQSVMLDTAQTISTVNYSPGAIFTWNGAAWVYAGQVANISTTGNTSTISIPPLLTVEPGLYKGRARFTLPDGTVRSEPVSFEVIDPLADHSNAAGEDGIVELAWMKLEDLFDSELGGPHLRDRTLANFNRDKLARLLPDAFYMVNATYQPAGSFDENTFPYIPHAPLLAQALLVSGIRHLMRSYVEQPNPVGGGQITYFDRRDYLQRWQSIYTIENQQFIEWMDLFKKDQMGYGQTSTLVGGYASWYGRYPRYMRGRYPYIMRW
jgi:hypothetical protein